MICMQYIHYLIAISICLPCYPVTRKDTNTIRSTQAAQHHTRATGVMKQYNAMTNTHTPTDTETDVARVMCRLASPGSVSRQPTPPAAESSTNSVSSSSTPQVSTTHEHETKKNHKQYIYRQIHSGSLLREEQHNLLTYIDKYGIHNLFTAQEQNALLHKTISRKTFNFLIQLHNRGLPLSYYTKYGRSALDRLFVRGQCLDPGSAPHQLVQACINENVPVTEYILSCPRRKKETPDKPLKQLQEFINIHRETAKKMSIAECIRNKLHGVPASNSQADNNA